MPRQHSCAWRRWHERHGAWQKERARRGPVEQQVDGGYWRVIIAEVDEYGGPLLLQLLAAAEAEQICGLYDQAAFFCTTIHMGRYCWGEGEYR
jgi:hypothetical protein